MLGKLLVRYLRPAWPLIIAVVVFQFAQSIASLLLPTLNADIIDNGVVTGDIPYIWQTGGVMLAISLVQIVCAIVAVYFGSRLAMGMGRDLRGDLFHRVVAFSQREVGQIGAPSLITRNTNDVQQVQMLVQVSATLMVSAPILAIGGVIFAVQQDAGLSWLMAVAIPVLLIIVGLIVSRMVPAFTKMQTRIDRVNQIMREQLNSDNPLTDVTLLSDGQTIYAAHSAEEVVDVFRRGQGVFGIAIGPVQDEVQGDIHQLFPDDSQYAGVLEAGAN